jgi:hypothetical protein
MHVLLYVASLIATPEPRSQPSTQSAEEPEVGGASGQSYFGARLGLGFKGLTVAGTPNFSTLPVVIDKRE